MWKFKMYLRDDKEEQWINTMSQKGWHLKKFFTFFYKFEQGTPGQYIYRNEMLDNKNSAEYIHFLEESNIEVVHRCFNWIYVRKPAIEGPFELYSDSTSKLVYINRLLSVFTLLTILNFICAIINVELFFNEGSQVNGTVSLLNIFVVILFSVPLSSYYKRRKSLKNELL